MNIIFAIVAAFPLGYFLRDSRLAIAVFLAAESVLFTFQTLTVLLAWLGHDSAIGTESAGAFGPYPTGLPLSFSEAELFSYGGVNLMIICAGIGLTLLGSHVRTRRSRRRAAGTARESAHEGPEQQLS